MASLLSREEWIETAQRLYDATEKSGADYTRLSTVRRKLVALLLDHGVEEPEATAADLVSQIRLDPGIDN